MNENAAYLAQAAQKAGYNPTDLATIMAYESGLNPGRWGGAGGNYYGLIQFGPEERQKFGVDTKTPSFNNQVDSSIRFLQARGYKPNMGLLDMYSTVLAGSPGHYNAADQNGSVAHHISQMDNARKQAQTFLGGEYNPPAIPATAQPSVAASATPMETTPTRLPQFGGIDETRKPLMSLLAPQEEETYQAPEMLSPISMPKAEAHKPSAAQIKKLRQRGLLG